MVKNGTVEEGQPMVAGEDVAKKDADVLPVIERRIAELKEQREQAAEQARMQDAAYQGAIQSMEQLRAEFLAARESEQ